MPEEATTGSLETRAESVLDDQPGRAAEGPVGLNVGLALLFVVIVVLVAIQNLWLRRRAEREARSDDTGKETGS